MAFHSARLYHGVVSVPEGPTARMRIETPSARVPVALRVHTVLPLLTLSV